MSPPSIDHKRRSLTRRQNAATAAQTQLAQTQIGTPYPQDNLYVAAPLTFANPIPHATPAPWAPSQGQASRADKKWYISYINSIYRISPKSLHATKGGRIITPGRAGGFQCPPCRKRKQGGSVHFPPLSLIRIDLGQG